MNVDPTGGDPGKMLRRPSLVKKTTTWIGAGALISFAVGIHSGISLAYISFGLLLIATLFHATISDKPLSIPLVIWVAVALSSYIFMHDALLQLTPYDEMGSDWRTTLRWFSVAGLPTLVIGYWLYQCKHLIVPCICLLIAGFIVRIPLNWEPGTLQLVMQGGRLPGFGNSATSFAVWSVICLTALIAMLPTLSAWQIKEKYRLLVVGLWSATFLFLATLLVLSNTRAAWLVALLALPVTAYVTLRLHERVTQHARYIMSARNLFVVILVILTTALLVTHADRIADRWSDEYETLVTGLQGDWDTVEQNSVGYRFRMYHQGIHYWLESPWLGHGTSASNSHLAEIQYKIGGPVFDNYHNTFINLLVELGIIGLVLFLSLTLSIMALGIKGFRSGQVPLPALIFGLSSITIFLLSALTNHLVASYRGPFVLAFSGALLCGWALFSRKTSTTSDNRKRTSL